MPVSTAVATPLHAALRTLHVAEFQLPLIARRASRRLLRAVETCGCKRWSTDCSSWVNLGTEVLSERWGSSQGPNWHSLILLHQGVAARASCPTGGGLLVVWVLGDVR
ncbi:unnamed protein product, partial [Ectocarpus sp. 12 AP-2014]